MQRRGDLFWHQFYLKMAHHVATASKDPTTKVGAVIVSMDRRFLSIGYNGFPRGVRDDERLHDRDLKRMLTAHAEENAVYNCTFDPHLVPSRIYVTGHPCHRCAVAIIQKGIKEVVYATQLFHSDWRESFDLADQALKEAGVLLIGEDVRYE